MPDTDDFEKAFGSAVDGGGTPPPPKTADDPAPDDADDPGIGMLTAYDEELPAATEGPGFLRRSLSWFLRWHPFFFLGVALCLAAVAWSVYPAPEEQVVPDARELYREGLDRLYRVMNPDLALYAATPEDEVLAARNAILNLFIFHRGDLRSYPDFVNPHLLLGEANSLLAAFSPALAEKHYAEALEAYEDARIWEAREDSLENLAAYRHANFIPDAPPPPIGEGDDGAVRIYLADHEDEIALRRARREDYIRYRRAEAEVNLGKPDLALADLERLGGERRAGRRERERDALAGQGGGADPELRAFELGPDEHFRLGLLLARAYDRLGRMDEAETEYQAYLASGRAGRDRVFVLERLAAIAMADGGVFERADPERAQTAYTRAAELFDAVAASPGADSGSRDRAILGSARAFSALAGMTPDGGRTVVDAIGEAGGVIRSWLEALSGQGLPRRTLALPEAIGKTFAKPEMLYPLASALPAAAAARVAAFAAGGAETPYLRRRALLTAAIDRYDRIAGTEPGSELAVRARASAALEAWRLGLADEAEARHRAMLDPLAPPELHAPARIGLAEIALERGDLDEAARLLLGGMTHRGRLWLEDGEADWRSIAARLGNPANRSGENPWTRLWERIGDEGREIALYAASGRQLDAEYRRRFLKALNAVLLDRDFHSAPYFAAVERNAALDYLLARDPETLDARDWRWLNRLLLEAAWPYELFRKASRDNVEYQPLPGWAELETTGLVEPGRVASLLARLARSWNAAAAGRDAPDAVRMRLAGVRAYEATLDRYRGDAGLLLPELARNHEALAQLREGQGRHRDALAFVAAAGRTYLAVTSRARGAASEMESLLAAGDAFFRAGLLERTVEALTLFLERFGYAAPPGSETAMSVARAENLLGRTYWFLGDHDRAVASFSNNLKRRTPERYKSMYYIGRVLMERSVAPNGDPAALGSPDAPMPNLDRDGDPIIETALQAFNFLRQAPGIDPTARAWRWAAFDLGTLHYMRAERARAAELERARTAAGDGGEGAPDPDAWVPAHGEARRALLEALDRYPLRYNGGAGGISVRVEPEDYADVMSARFEAEYRLANSLLRLADAGGDPELHSLARSHLANLAERSRYADALFDPAFDRFQLNAAVIDEAVSEGGWERSRPLPRTRLGDDEGPTRSPARMRMMRINAALLLADSLFQAGERAQARGDDSAPGFYRQAYDAYQSIHDRYGAEYGSLAMLGMADSLSRLGQDGDAANHYRMAENIARLQDPAARSDGLLDIGPAFWGAQASGRLRDRSDGYGF
ncbi:MAG: hypothetical protein LBJ46_03440 [Planctomycetota bacterium]|jgi:hypothetical protein|nr:hypothetical protein [Planctomycetota bacterium]